MKKILAVIAVAATMVASTFAFDLALGGRGLIGGNLGEKSSDGEGFVVGGGAYLNLGLFKGFGLQAEANFQSSKVKVVSQSGDDPAHISTTQCNIMDFPVMAWYNYKFTKIAIGGGVGVNFSTYLDKNKRAENTNGMNIGMAVGANFKYYFTDRIGLVLGANGVFDFNATTVKDGETTNIYFGGTDNTRKSLYGTIGVEFKIF